MANHGSNFPPTSNRNPTKSLIIPSTFLLIIYVLFFRQLNVTHPNPTPSPSPTNLSHIFFSIASTSSRWPTKRSYIQSWWVPNATRGLLFLDRSPIEQLPWPPTYPPLRVSDDISRYRAYYKKHPMPFVVRMVRVVEEAFGEEGVRWYVMADDDTVVMVDNLVEVLAGYDHRKYFYIGMNSESVASNSVNSFEMAFGGAGYALSYPLAKAVAANMDVCIRRYPSLFGSDHILQACIADLGVSLTLERGFHQIDLHRDISGFLSAHPQSPLLSLHHLEAVDPIFPSMNRIESLYRLMEAASADQSRLLQQTVCSYSNYSWTFSVSWGYSVQLYDAVFPPSYLYRPLETFIPWKRGAAPPYMFNARRRSRDPCHDPHSFFFDSVEEERVMGRVVTRYVRAPPRGSPACGNRTADGVSGIRVLSPAKKIAWQQQQNGGRRECCDVVHWEGMDSLAIKLRDCMTDELVA